MKGTNRRRIELIRLLFPSVRRRLEVVGKLLGIGYLIVWAIALYGLRAEGVFFY